MEYLSFFGNICSILGLLVGIFVAWRINVVVDIRDNIVNKKNSQSILGNENMQVGGDFYETHSNNKR